MRRPNRSFSSKIVGAFTVIAASGVLICVLAVAALLFVNGQANAVIRARSNAAQLSSDLAAHFNSAAQVTREIRQLTESAAGDARLPRDVYMRRLKATLGREPELHGAWLIAEPDGYDQQDKRFEGQFGASVQGEFFPYWYRSDTGQLVQDTTGKRNDVAKDRASPFYRDPVLTNSIVVTQPYSWTLGEGAGAAKIMTSVAAPVRIGSRLVGVVGVDFYLAPLSRIISRKTQLGSHFALVSDGGTIALSGDASLLGQPVSRLELPSNLWTPGRQAHGHHVGRWSGEQAIIVSEKVRFEGAAGDWLLIVAEPMGAALARTWTLVTVALLVGFALVALAAWLAARLARSLSRPINDMSRALTRLANGELIVDLPQDRGSLELDEMARAVQSFRDHAKRAVEAETARAAADRLVGERSAQLRLTSANLPLAEFLTLATREAMAATLAKGAVLEMLEGDMLVVRAASGELHNLLGMTLLRDASLSGQAIQTQTPLLCDDTELDERVDRDAARRIGVRSMALAPLIDEGQSIGVLKVASTTPRAFRKSDVTALQLLADVLGAAIGRQMAREAAQQANEAKSAFLANMSHEIRTPLNGVIGMADMLSRSDLAPNDKELVEIIRASGETLNRLLSDILDQARIEAGQLTVEKEAFHLADALRSVASLHRLRADEKGLEVRLNLAADLETFFLGDEVRTRQIVGNLISNAIKFTDQGSVTLAAYPSALGRVRIEVEDTGVGFAPELREHIFSRFAQADGSITRRFGGSGLGLTICRQLVELLEGTIGCETAPGQGSLFWLELPLQPGASPGQAGPTQVHTPAGALTALIADDHPTNRRVIELMLGEMGVAVTSVDDGRAAVEAFAKTTFDFVLMDMQMPVMDGLSATRAIRRLESEDRRDRTPVLMLTANVLAEHVRAASLAGADGHIAKPINALALAEAISQALVAPEG